MIVSEFSPAQSTAMRTNLIRCERSWQHAVRVHDAVEVINSDNERSKAMESKPRDARHHRTCYALVLNNACFPSAGRELVQVAFRVKGLNIYGTVAGDQSVVFGYAQARLEVNCFPRIIGWLDHWIDQDPARKFAREILILEICEVFRRQHPIRTAHAAQIGNTTRNQTTEREISMKEPM